jgi:hypothetical protein
MPVGPASAQAFKGNPNFSVDNATVWKGNNDSNAAIISPFGSLYVFPNNPAAMNVLVDVGANIPQAGFAAPIFLNGSASPVTVSLAAPGSNSYYATIYWDQQAQAPGVVYGASGASPSPILPDTLSQIPLALVLIASTDTTIQPAAITDVRSWLHRSTVPKVQGGTLSANTSLECNGLLLVQWDFSYNAAITVTLNNLRIGAEVRIVASNTSGSTQNLKIAANAPSGAAYSVSGKVAGVAGGASNLTTTGVNIAASAAYLLHGPAFATSLLFLSIS